MVEQNVREILTENESAKPIGLDLVGLKRNFQDFSLISFGTVLFKF